MRQRQATPVRLASHDFRATPGKVWLPTLLYESLPYLYLLTGVVALFAILYVSDWYRSLPLWLMLAGLSIHGGLRILWLRYHYRRGEITETADND
ncbi:MAG: hypothetical protein AAGA84_10245 [Pseudomonadota bacterium]